MLLNVFVCRSVNIKHLFTYQFKQTFDKTFVTVRPSSLLASITEFINYTLFIKKRRHPTTCTCNLLLLNIFPFASCKRAKMIMLSLLLSSMLIVCIYIFFLKYKTCQITSSEALCSVPLGSVTETCIIQNIKTHQHI